MHVDPLISHVSIGHGLPWYHPDGELIVSCGAFDRPNPSDPFWNLYDVAPAVIATAGQLPALAAVAVELSGLRVGTLTITQFETYQYDGPTDQPLTVYVAPGNGTSWFHSLDNESGEYPNYPDLFGGGVIDWGDGSTSQVDSSLSRVDHTYAAAGTYDIRLELHFAPAVNFAWSGYPAATRRLVVS